MNYSSSSQAMFLPIPPTSIGILILEVAVLLIIDIAAFAGNLLVCLAYRNQRLRTGTNVYIIALAVTDILAATITVPMTLGSIMKGKWAFGVLGCQIQGFFAHFLIYTSMYTLALTAVNRYFRIVKTKYYKTVFGGRRPLILIALVLVFVGLFVSIPPLLGWARFQFEPGVALYMCILEFNTTTGSITFLLLVLMFFVILSMSLIIASYVEVSRAMRQHKLNLQATVMNRRRIANVSVEEIKITRTLFILVMAFIVCWIPVYSVVSIIRSGLGGSLTNTGSLITTYLIFLSSAINPYIYAFNHRTFRNEFKRILKKGCGRSERAPKEAHVIHNSRSLLGPSVCNPRDVNSRQAGPSFGRTLRPYEINVPAAHFKKANTPQESHLNKVDNKTFLSRRKPFFKRNSPLVRPEIVLERIARRCSRSKDVEMVCEDAKEENGTNTKYRNKENNN
ncbi:melatonin receptor type 1A-like [Exaiptasia diaphana]|uniref:G-protein coupled receptors family 1 profile domain-containing protein n=1 Tax=Exaiptasia diaphana TaxID=2652724 RepID=A0A913X8E0_EXADI|nr:melatonin receptor type 1A-like [Exaiptasia diaphana]